MSIENTPPILFIVFNRMDNTTNVFSSIKKSKPKKLYISSDGARKNVAGEAEKVLAIRTYLLKQIDWDCEVKTLFHDENQGCKYAPHKAICWFFEQEEKGIILEDDCLPSQSFYKFTAELLDKYENDLRVFGISGINFQSNKFSIKDSYYFSDFFMTWGWATWRSRWEKHLTILKDFETYMADPDIFNVIPNKIANEKLVSFAKKGFNDELDAWDYQWILSCMINNGMIATPSSNLIQNIGFGPEATHTTSANKRDSSKEELNFPLNHPKIMVTNQEIDNSFYKNINGWLSSGEKLMHLSYIKAGISSKIKQYLPKS